MQNCDWAKGSKRQNTGLNLVRFFQSIDWFPFIHRMTRSKLDLVTGITSIWKSGQANNCFDGFTFISTTAALQWMKSLHVELNCADCELWAVFCMHGNFSLHSNNNFHEYYKYSSVVYIYHRIAWTKINSFSNRIFSPAQSTHTM